MDEVELKANDNTIKFVIEKRKWCRIYFVKHNTIIKLGADALDIIIPKLVHAINTDAERKYFLYKEMKIFTILCLMEPHTVIVGRNTHD